MNVLRLDSEGPVIRTQDDAMDLIATTFTPGGAETIVVPVERLDPDFFRLASGVAGEVAQKFANYRRRLVVLGDVSAFVAGSDAFRDWVREANRGQDVWFLADDEELARRLG
jgi:Domain of unknown function (DUF4180)